MPEALVVGAATTSETADAAALFSVFYAERRAEVVRLAALLVDDRATAEEVAQDAFARLYERWGRARDPLAYVRTCTVNRARDVLRRRRLARRVDRPTVDEARPAEHDLLRDALAALPPRQRAAIVLRYYSGLSVEETAEAMRTRPGTVKSLVHRGVAALREVIER